MKKFNPNKNIIITLIIVILVVTVLSVTIARRAAGNSTNVVQSTVNDSVGFIDKVITHKLQMNWNKRRTMRKEKSMP